MYSNLLFPIPDHMSLSQMIDGHHNQTPITLLRFVQHNKQVDRWGDEHFSLCIDRQNHRLLGMIHLEKNMVSDDCIDEEKAKQIAFEFLANYANDMLQSVEVRWIKPTKKIPLSPPHDEGFKLNDQTIITGMRVKLWDNSSQTYAWVIVNAFGQVINFERNIVWDNIQKCRLTARWLHDHWLEDYLGQQKSCA